MAEKVLLIDDETDFLQNLSDRMNLRGMEVTTAQDGNAALDAVNQDSFDAVVLDLQMPGMDGIEVLKRIKAERPNMQIILLTGHASLEKGVEAMRLGAMDFMEKPADINSLTEKIHKAQAKKMLLVERETEAKMKEIMGSKGW
ncbi:response regulator [Pseudodesulfovibrio senegalensis]|jgi:DNA-binding NtrC family response regulator|uniref:Response regulator n=1 Tax=Pseudodesulfovibrio senegalensis TaxID=1721087 RepID=A0A6N6N0B3_9BACT|nr:response regulator [Pseudodesulfovibrio senegalensis]KAB1441337.1 response regulator [Pseudodesulfovibrio senegalensis]